MLEDYKIIRRLRRGDTHALREVYMKYKDQMYTMALALLNEQAAAEDVLNDAFMSFAKKAPTFEPYESVKTYLAGRIISRSRDMLHSRMYKVVEVHKADGKSQDNKSSPEEMEKVQATAIMDALTDVPLPQREAVVLGVYGGLDFSRIAKILRINPDAAQSRYRYGLEKLHSVLDGQIQ